MKWVNNWLKNEERCIFNSLLNDKILDQSNLKAIVDDKIKDQKSDLSCKNGRTNCGKRENVGFQYVLLFTPVFLSKSILS